MKNFKQSFNRPQSAFSQKANDISGFQQRQNFMVYSKQQPPKQPKASHFDNERLLEIIQELKLSNNKLKEENMQVKTQIAFYEKELNKYETYFEHSSTQKKPFQQRNDYSNAHLVNKLKKTIKDMKNEIAYKNNELQTIKKQIKLTKINELEIEKKEFENETIRLRGLLEEAQSENLQTLMQQQSFSSLEEKFYQQHNQLQQSQKENQDLIQNMQMQEIQLSEMQEKEKQLIKNYEQAKRKLKSKENENSKLISELEKLYQMQGQVYEHHVTQTVSSRPTSGIGIKSNVSRPQSGRPQSSKRPQNQMQNAHQYQQQNQANFEFQPEQNTELAKVNKLLTNQKDSYGQQPQKSNSFNFKKENQIIENISDFHKIQSKDKLSQRNNTEEQQTNEFNEEEDQENENNVQEKDSVEDSSNMHEQIEQQLELLADDIYYKLIKSDIESNEFEQVLFSPNQQKEKYCTFVELKDTFTQKPFLLEENLAIILTAYIIQGNLPLQFNEFTNSQQNNQLILENFIAFINQSGSYERINKNYSKKYIEKFKKELKDLQICEKFLENHQDTTEIFTKIELKTILIKANLNLTEQQYDYVIVHMLEQSSKDSVLNLVIQDFIDAFYENESEIQVESKILQSNQVQGKNSVNEDIIDDYDSSQNQKMQQSSTIKNEQSQVQSVYEEDFENNQSSSKNDNNVQQQSQIQSNLSVTDQVYSDDFQKSSNNSKTNQQEESKQNIPVYNNNTDDYQEDEDFEIEEDDDQE